MDRDDLRIGDAEREQTMASLREHFAQGRLTHEELDQRLDQALAARTGRDLAQVTADLPGQQRGYREPAQHHDLDWREAMRAHRRQMRAAHHEGWDRRGPRPGPPWHAPRSGPPWRGHRGPGPIVPILFAFLIIGLMVGGLGVLKVLFFVWIGAMILGFATRRFRCRR
ncbi:DUF1707 SHOCT-like domain-containing protein [Nonomuraea sp. LPB2021202275-12-8]|uniref:DUF1707 SHOCT-like domain-containing protein n=1 Tax=Nonomuraea sp. LPB2021202275-12-8 TaxID=3120159 RepID=UPI00300D84C3